MLTKKEAKVLKRIEAKYRQAFNNKFVELMLEHIPFDDKDSIQLKVPCKQKLLKLIEAAINPNEHLAISGMLFKFINERYEVIDERSL